MYYFRIADTFPSCKRIFNLWHKKESLIHFKVFRLHTEFLFKISSTFLQKTRLNFRDLKKGFARKYSYDSNFYTKHDRKK